LLFPVVEHVKIGYVQAAHRRAFGVGRDDTDLDRVDVGMYDHLLFGKNAQERRADQQECKLEALAHSHPRPPVAFHKGNYPN
jgi:hypothetical protein